MSKFDFDFAAIAEMELGDWSGECDEAFDALGAMVNGRVALESAYDAGEMINAWNQPY